MLKLIEFISSMLAERLKEPFVSQDYSEHDRVALLRGLERATTNAFGFNGLSKQHILETFAAMKPLTREKMLLPTRKSPVGIYATKDSISVSGLDALLNWAENNSQGHGPRFVLISAAQYQVHFNKVTLLREKVGVKDNTELAKHLYQKIYYEGFIMQFVPPFDSLNFFHDLSQPPFMLAQTGASLDSKYGVYDVVAPKLEEIIDMFNEIQSPTINDIARVVKNLLTLHPFLDGNGRTFTLGILNQLLLNNGFGLCIKLDPQLILFKSLGEFVDKIKENLISLSDIPQDILEESAIPIVKKTTSMKKLRLRQKKITPQSLAHAIWLTDAPLEKELLHGSMWAKKKCKFESREDFIKETRQCLEKYSYFDGHLAP